MWGAFVVVVQAVAERLGIDLSKLFDEQAPLLLRQAQRLGGTHIDAEDAVQDVFLIAHRQRDRIDPDGNPGAWLYGVLRNVILHHRRRAAKVHRDRNALQQEPAPSVPTADEPLEAQHRRDRLLACLATLPERQRHVFSLFELEECSGAEVAQRLSMSENAVYVTLSRARARLRDAWLAQDQKAPAEPQPGASLG